MTPFENITRRETVGSRHLWTGLLGGPLAWSVQLGLTWALSEIVACSPASSPEGTVFGAPLRTVTGALVAVLAAATVASGIVAYRCLARLRTHGDDSPGSRATFMAVAGVMTSVLFTIVITVASVPVLVIGGCR